MVIIHDTQHFEKLKEEIEAILFKNMDKISIRDVNTIHAYCKHLLEFAWMQQSQIMKLQKDVQILNELFQIENRNNCELTNRIGKAIAYFKK